MCGICGIFKYDKNSMVSEAVIEKMAETMNHRGPDDKGIYVNNNIGLGHRRLSIFDVKRGKQPMTNEDESIWIVFNGAIYNYIELKQYLEKKGHMFKTNSDTEVLIHIYEEYGQECLQYLNGMFAFAIWDLKKQELFISRDRIGIKPLYYYIDEEGIIFASEIKAIIQCEEICKKPNYSAIAQYLKLTFSTNEQTFFKGILKLMPGHWLRIRKGKADIKQYWSPNNGKIEWKKEEDVIVETFNHLENAVRLRLGSDVPLGFHLSGGLDSSSIVTIAHNHYKDKIKTFSVVFNNDPEYDESEYIKAISESCHAEHNSIAISAEDSLKAIEKLVYFMDEPQASSGALAQYSLNGLIHKHVKVALGGQGGDELFGGYYRYLPFIFKKNIEHLNMGSIISLYKIINYSISIGMSKITHKLLRRRGIVNILNNDFIADGIIETSYQSTPINDMKYYIPALLQVEDRTSMAFSVESRVPLLDHKLIEYMNSVPWELKMKNAELKYLLKRIMANKIPNKILYRRDKKGLMIPLGKWFRTVLKNYLEDILSNEAIKKRGIFKPDVVRQMIDMHMSNKRDYSEQLWQLLNVELWFRIFMDK